MNTIKEFFNNKNNILISLVLFLLPMLFSSLGYNRLSKVLYLVAGYLTKRLSKR